MRELYRLRQWREFLEGAVVARRNIVISGATGSGKSQTARALLESLSRAPQPVPWLVIEPAKAEYARMRGRLGDDDSVLVVRPGDAAVFFPEDGHMPTLGLTATPEAVRKSVVKVPVAS